MPRARFFALMALTGLAVMAACGGDDGPANGPPPVGTGGSPTGTGSTGGGPASTTRATLVGDVTWTVTFDAEAKAAGATDCTYTRRYEAVQDDSAPWLCPECEAMFRAEVSIIEGESDCYDQVSDLDPEDTEWIGWAGGTYYRGLGAAMSAQGTATLGEGEVTVADTVVDLLLDDGGTFDFAIAGSFALGEESGDPLHGFDAPSSYECGWPSERPPAYEGSYTLAVGEPVPDGVFIDSCGDPVRLHDFEGAYLIIDMAAPDCPPCQQWASGEESFRVQMDLQGIEVFVITLMAPSLDDPLGETSVEELEDWVDTFGLSSPVLADRGWGPTILSKALGIGNASFPSWIVVDRDLSVITWGNGFPGWPAFEATILAAD